MTLIINDKLADNYNTKYMKNIIDAIIIINKDATTYPFISFQLENEKSLNIKITGIYDDKWLVQINNLNLKISNLLDKDFNNDEPYEALVSKVVDGDTVIVYKKNKRINLRLSNIDSPEKIKILVLKLPRF